MLRRSMIGNTSGMSNLAITASGVVHHRRNDLQSGAMLMNAGNNNPSASASGNHAAYKASLVSHFAEDLDRRRSVFYNF